MNTLVEIIRVTICHFALCDLKDKANEDSLARKTESSREPPNILNDDKYLGINCGFTEFHWWIAQLHTFRVVVGCSILGLL